MLSRERVSLLEQLRKFTRTGFEAALKKRKAWRCFQRVVSFCCDIPGTSGSLSIRQGAARYQPSGRRRISFEDMMRGRKSATVLLAARAETQRQVQSMKGIAGRASERDRSQAVIRTWRR